MTLIFGFYLYQTGFALAQKSAFTNLKEMDANLGSKIEEIRRLQDELERINQQQSALKAVTGNPYYSQLLLKLARMMNGYTWLTGLTIDSSKQNEEYRVMKLTGVSSLREELGNFLNLLAGEPLFEDVLLKYARETVTERSGQNVSETKRLIQFQIECKILRGIG